jgi:hypothetical protein
MAARVDLSPSPSRRRMTAVCAFLPLASRITEGQDSAQRGRLHARHAPLHVHPDAPAMGSDRRPAWWSGGRNVLAKKSVSPLDRWRAAVSPLPPRVHALSIRVTFRPPKSSQRSTHEAPMAEWSRAGQEPPPAGRWSRSGCRLHQDSPVAVCLWVSTNGA